MEEFNELEYLSECSGEEAAECEGWSIKDDHTASWAIAKIKDELEEEARLIDICEKQIQILDAKMDEIQKRTEKRTAFLKYKLIEYFNKVEKGKKSTKTQESYDLVTGKIIMKKAKQKMVPDKAKLLEVCKATGMTEFIKVKEEVDWAKYKNECEIVDGRAVNVQTGDILDYVAVEEVPASFEIKMEDYEI